MQQFHISYPLRQGMPLQDFRGQIKLKTAPFVAVLQSMIAAGLVSTNEASICIPAHTPSLSPAEEAEAKEYLSFISTDRYSPSTERLIDIELLQFLSERGDVVRAHLEPAVILVRPVVHQEGSQAGLGALHSVMPGL